MNSARTKGRLSRGYSLIEAVVSAALVGVGVTAILGAYSAMIRNETRSVENEQMQRLAFDKYEELVATEALQTQSLNGDFSDRGDDNHLWTASVASTGTENLSDVTVTVTPRQTDDTAQASVSGVVYIPPQTASGSATNPAGGG